jgi:hypothetical protein
MIKKHGTRNQQQVTSIMQPETNKRVAIPVTNQQLSEFFGTCSHYEIFEIKKKILNRYELQIPVGTTLIDLPEWLEKRGVTDVIAYKVNKQIISLFASRKVNLFVGVRQDNPQNLIDKYLQGRLESDKKIIAEITEN